MASSEAEQVEVLLRAPGGPGFRTQLTRAGTRWKGALDIPAGSDWAVAAQALDATGHVVARRQVAGITIAADSSVLVVLVLEPNPQDLVIESLVAAPAVVEPGGAVNLRLVARSSQTGLSTTWSAEAGTFAGPSSASTTWKAPNKQGNVTLLATVAVPSGLFRSLSVKILSGKGSAEVEASFNNWPVVSSLTADPGRVEAGGTSNLVLAASDPDGDPLTVSWVDDCGGSFALPSTTGATWTGPSTPPADGTCTLTAEVVDGRGGQTAGALTVLVGPAPSANTAPTIVSAFQSRTVASAGETVVFRVLAMDPDADPLSFAWSASAGTLPPPITTASSSEVSWTVPQGGCGYSVSATVQDSHGASTSHRFKVSCPSCGDGVVQAGESCDGTALSGASCQGQGFTTGCIACTEICTLDTTGCRAVSLLSSPTKKTLYAVGGSVASAWAVGQGGTLLQLEAAGAVAVPSPVQGQLEGVWGSSAANAWAVGEAGTLLRFDGIGWSEQQTITTNALRAISGTGPGDVWAAGGDGTVLRFDGSSWSAIPSGTLKGLEAVWAGPTEVWAVGASGTALHGGPAGFTVVPTPTTETLYGVWGSSSSSVWAVGGAGTLLHFDGATWSSVSSGTTSDLFGIWGSSADDIWVVGESGTLLHRDTAGWSAVPSGTKQDLYGVWGASASEAWAVGDSGVVLQIAAGTDQ